MAEETTFTTQYADQLPTGGHRQIGRGYQKTVIVDHEPQGTALPKSPEIPTKPGDRHLIISVIMLFVSVIIFNPIALGLAILAVAFSVQSRKAELEGKKESMQSYDKIAFGFAIFCIITHLVSISVAIFVTYTQLCGSTGVRWWGSFVVDQGRVMSETNQNVTVLVRNPSYSVPMRQQVNKREARTRVGSIVLFDQESVLYNAAPGNEYPEFEKTGSSSKWDHHITLAIVFTVISLLCLNPFALFCGIASVFYAITARIASRNGEYEVKLENERVSFAFAVVCMIALIVYFCIIAFTIYAILCGTSGQFCRF